MHACLYREYRDFGVNADQGCCNVECIPDRRDQVILIPPFQGGSPNTLNKRQVCLSGYWTVGIHIDVLCIVGASGLLYCSQRAWRRLSSPRFSPRCGRTAPSVKPDTSDASNAQLILRFEIAGMVLGTCIPTCPASIPLRARMSASSWVKRRYRWDPKMTEFLAIFVRFR